MYTDNTKKLLGAFSVVSGTKIALFDRHYHCLVQSGDDVPTYCSELHRSKKCRDCCKQSDILAFRRAERTGKVYWYKCPFGLHEAVAPILANESVVGYLIFGPVNTRSTGQDSHILDRAKAADETLDLSRLSRFIGELPRYSEKTFAAYSELLSALATQIGSTVRDDEQTKTVGQLIKAYLAKNLHRKITLAELGMHLHCSTVTLTENFHREYGITIMQYLQKKRLDLAEQLLTETALPITAVAEQCGFSDVAYFSRCFKSAKGSAPSDFRREHSAVENTPARIPFEWKISDGEGC